MSQVAPGWKWPGKARFWWEWWQERNWHLRYMDGCVRLFEGVVEEMLFWGVRWGWSSLSTGDWYSYYIWQFIWCWLEAFLISSKMFSSHGHQFSSPRILVKPSSQFSWRCPTIEVTTLFPPWHISAANRNVESNRLKFRLSFNPADVSFTGLTKGDP